MTTSEQNLSFSEIHSSISLMNNIFSRGLSRKISKLAFASLGIFEVHLELDKNLISTHNVCLFQSCQRCLKFSQKINFYQSNEPFATLKISHDSMQNEHYGQGHE